jgi:hypothetical protein
MKHLDNSTLIFFMLNENALKKIANQIAWALHKMYQFYSKDIK